MTMEVGTGRSGGRMAGFTLIELLVVIGIIGILIALALAVGSRVASSGKERVTEQTLRALEGSLDAYIQAKGGMPGATVLDPRKNGSVPNSTYLWPVADARNMSSTSAVPEMINSVGLFILQTRGVPSAEAAFKNIDTRYLHTYDADGGTATAWTSQPELLTAFDGWGNPIRYVHPAFHGIVGLGAGNPPAQVDVDTVLGPAPSPRQYAITQIRRGTAPGTGPATPPDSDGGLCTAGRPYFYSCGADGDPSTTGDNVYVVRPQVQKN
jgi:prepilin-type N-terminal cleavage/methylation domain-containing protein